MVLTVLTGKAWSVNLDPDSNKRLILPEFFIGDAGAGKRVKVTPSEYAGTQVYHTLYLPSNWNPKGTLHS